MFIQYIKCYVLLFLSCNKKLSYWLFVFLQWNTTFNLELGILKKWKEMGQYTRIAVTCINLNIMQYASRIISVEVAVQLRNQWLTKFEVKKNCEWWSNTSYIFELKLFRALCQFIPRGFSHLIKHNWPSLIRTLHL